MNIQIRKATIHDMEDVRQLVIALAIYEKEPEAVIATTNDYKEAFEKGIFEVMVAVDGSKIIGMVLYYMTFSTWKGKCMYLEDFFVLPEYRKLGIGQQLFDAYIEATQRSGARMAKWQVLDWNESAHEFYRKNNAILETNWWNGKMHFNNM